MNCSSSMWSSSAQSGSQNCLMLASRIGFLWRPSCAQVICSTSSSSVPTPPGSATKASASLEHALLALVHVARDDQIAARVGVLAVDQEFRDDAGHLAAVLEHGVGELAHQADRAAAIDEADAVLGQDLAERRARPATKAGSVPGPEPQ